MTPSPHSLLQSPTRAVPSQVQIPERVELSGRTRESEVLNRVWKDWLIWAGEPENGEHSRENNPQENNSIKYYNML